MYETLDEDALIELAREEPVAFAALYRRYLTPVYRYLIVRTGNSQDAEDLTSRTFIDVLEGLFQQRYKAGGNFPAWLFTIARRRLVDHYRQKDVDPLEDPVAFDPNLLEEVQKTEDSVRLEEMLSQLDENKRELLNLRFAAGLTFAEIGILEGKSEAAVKMSVYRTIEWLRENWDEEND